MDIMYFPLLEKIGIVCYGLSIICYGYEMKSRKKYLKPNHSLTNHELAVMKWYKASIIVGTIVTLISIWLVYIL